MLKRLDNQRAFHRCRLPIFGYVPKVALPDVRYGIPKFESTHGYFIHYVLHVMDKYALKAHIPAPATDDPDDRGTWYCGDSDI